MTKVLDSSYRVQPIDHDVQGLAVHYFSFITAQHSFPYTSNPKLVLLIDVKTEA